MTTASSQHFHIYEYSSRSIQAAEKPELSRISSKVQNPESRIQKPKARISFPEVGRSSSDLGPLQQEARGNGEVA